MEEVMRHSRVPSSETSSSAIETTANAQRPKGGTAGYLDESSSRDGGRYDDQLANELVRSYSQGLHRAASQTEPNVNPFLSSSPKLDPSSPKFDAKEWAKALLHHSVAQPDKYPRNTAGVAFQNLNVHGYGWDTDYQKTVLNVLLQAPAILKQWVSQRRRKVDVLRDFNGLISQGEMLLVLGRPGSGVSTLLKTIAGETNGLHLGPESHFSYQGIPKETMHASFRGEAVYMAEEDVHFPHLTVGQTLQFAAVARTPKTRLPGVSRQLYASHVRDVVMAVFGISHTANTKVGNDFVRGVSGGERKRVSIAEVTLSQSPIQCWDNSTRGLDSATALEFTRTLRTATDVVGTAAIVAMYQASQPAYDTFDKVAVLYEGRLIYFGPKDLAKQFFVDRGYHCPQNQTTADFLTSLTNPTERIVQPGAEKRVPRTPGEFADIWNKSLEKASLMKAISEFEEQYPMNGAETEKFMVARKAQQAPLTRPKSPYTISVPMQIHLCMTRGYQRLLGEKLFFAVTVGGNLAISLLLGSIFYQMPSSADSIQDRCVLLFFSILFNGLSSTLEILALYAQRPVVEKQSRYALYHPFSEAISSMICDLPSKILSTICFNFPLYFMAGLRQEADAFFTYLLFGFTTTLTMSMILRTTGQASRTIHQALTPAALVIIGLVVYTGFVLPTRLMQDWLRWLNYVDPIAYSFEALVANEFTGRNFPCEHFIPPYPDATTLQRACSVSGARLGEDFIDGDFYIDATYGYSQSHIWRNFGILVAYTLFFLACYIIAAEYISTGRSKGEVLVFQRRDKTRLSSASRATDEESASHAGQPDPCTTTKTPGNKQDADGHHRTAAVFHWHRLCYDITINGEPRRILDNVSGWVRPGTLTALMGATGAGKTTLLDVLADRVTMGVVGGDISVNGSPRPRSFQRKTGYVQQQDIHLPTSTIREAMRFSAMLRRPTTVSKEEKYAHVEAMIEILEMQTYSNAIVGVPGEGLNVEQRKRLTIGVELAAKPDLLLFLDEPTSGLDSQTAWTISALIRKLSDSGQAILCTIHQPSALLFQQFDRLLLLAKGGKTVYFGDLGEGSRLLIDYFERQGAPRCRPDENPAEWMLKVIGASPGSQTERDWALTWRQSLEYEEMNHGLSDLGDSQAAQGHLVSSTDETDSNTYANPFHMQLRACLVRAFQHYWRTPSYIYAKMVLSGGTALFIGASFFNAPLSMQGLQNQMFAVFMLLVVFAFLVYQAMPNFIIQRDLYEARERAASMYSWVSFMLANILVELPWNSLASVLMYVTFYYLTGMHRNAEPTDSVTERSGLMFLLLWIFMLFQSTFASMVVAGVDMAEVGATIALLLFSFSLIFCGVIVPRAQLPGFWIFMYRVSPLTYLVSALLSTGLAHNDVVCADIELLQFQPPPNTTCGDYLQPFLEKAGGRLADSTASDMCQLCTLAKTDTFLDSVEACYDDRWRNYSIMWAYTIFNIFAALFLYWTIRVPKGPWLLRCLQFLRLK